MTNTPLILKEIPKDEAISFIRQYHYSKILPRLCKYFLGIFSEEKLCREPQSFPCRGYGECVLWKDLLNGQNDCIDNSDEGMQPFFVCMEIQRSTIV